MHTDQVKQLVVATIPDAEVDVAADGNNYAVTVTSTAFVGLTTVAAHKLVYAALDEPIRQGHIHAVRIRTLTPDRTDDRLGT